MSETKQQHWTRRGQELTKMSKSQLCSLYRKLGGMGGTHPPEKWYKEEIIGSIVEMEWMRLPEEQKLPDPPRLTPPCDECGQGENATAHQYGGDHHWVNTFDANQKWVPESEAEAERLAGLGLHTEDRELYGDY